MMPTLDLEHIAELARLSLTDEEKKRFSSDMKDIVAFCDRLPDSTRAPLPIQDGRTSVCREDIPNEAFCREWLMYAAKTSLDGYVTVPRVIKEEEQ